MRCFLRRRAPDEPAEPGSAVTTTDLGDPDDELDASPLAQRLRQLAWPAPAPGAKERCLADLMRRLETAVPPRD